MPHLGCTHAHAPSWLELTRAEDALDLLIADTFGVGALVSVQKQKDNPLDHDGHAAAIRALLRQILSAILPVEHRAESQLLRVLDVDWPALSEAERDHVIARAVGVLVGLGDVVPPRIGSVFEAAGHRHVTNTKEAIQERHGLSIDPTFNAVDELVIQHMATSQALFIRNAYGRRGDAASKLARHIAATGVAQGLDKRDIGAAMKEAFKGTAEDRAESYFRMAASVFLGRTRSYATVSSFAEAEIEASEWSCSMSETSCDACRHLDGEVFRVSEQVQSFLDVAQADDPEEVKFRQPFVSKGKDADGEYLYFRERDGSRVEVARVAESAVGQRDKKGSYRSLMGAAALTAKGVCVPPLHGHCMCILVPVGKS